MKSKKIIFSILATLLPLTFLALVELSLWIFNAYSQPPLFLEVKEDPGYMMINSQVGERYFDSNVMPVPNLYPQRFAKHKNTQTTRIFCVGGSTTAGFPYEMTVPFPKQLEMMLEVNHPERQFEVLNLGLSAINSFTVLDWVPEILDQDPDLILMYMGHNEFYGAYGTGSTISLGHDGRIVRLVMKMQKFRTVQMISSLFRGMSKPPSAVDNPTLMEKVIDDKFIESSSVLRVKTRHNFASNMEIILSRFQTAGIPVVVSNLASNMKDQIPLDITSIPGKESSKAYGLYQKGLREFNQGDTATAYISFRRARNSDQVPFRGNDYINEIIFNKASQYGARQVDMEIAFRRASQTGIPGDELFCDHLHPNPVGYHLMAREFLDVIYNSGIILRPQDEITSTAPILVTDLDWEIGNLKIYKLLHRWPFGDKPVDYSEYVSPYGPATLEITKDYLFDHTIWGKAHEEMAEHFLEIEEFAKACEEYQAIVETYPEKVEFYTKLVECARQAKLYDLVESTCERALEHAVETGMFHYNLAIAKRVSGEMEAAITHIEAALKAPELTRIQSANVNFTYARLLIDLRQPSEAAVVLTQLVRDVPEFTQARELLTQILD